MVLPAICALVPLTVRSRQEVGFRLGLAQARWSLRVTPGCNGLAATGGLRQSSPASTQ